MPTRALVTSYQEDLKLFPDMWHRVGLVVFILLGISFPLLANDYWLSIANNALIAVVAVP